MFALMMCAPTLASALAAPATTTTARNVTSLKKVGIVEEEEEMEWGELMMLSLVEMMDRLV